MMEILGGLKESTGSTMSLSERELFFGEGGLGVVFGKGKQFRLDVGLEVAEELGKHGAMVGGLGEVVRVVGDEPKTVLTARLIQDPIGVARYVVLCDGIGVSGIMEAESGGELNGSFSKSGHRLAPFAQVVQLVVHQNHIIELLFKQILYGRYIAVDSIVEIAKQEHGVCSLMQPRPSFGPQLKSSLDSGKISVPSGPTALASYSPGCTFSIPARWQVTNKKLVCPKAKLIPMPPLFPNVFAIPVATVSV
jgi:hypothetical protein